MISVETIQQQIQELPEPLQAEVLDFVEFLLSKVDGESSRKADSQWQDMSLASAMLGMEDEEMPEYTLADLKVTYR